MAFLVVGILSFCLLTYDKVIPLSCAILHAVVKGRASVRGPANRVKWADRDCDKEAPPRLGSSTLEGLALAEDPEAQRLGPARMISYLDRRSVSGDVSEPLRIPFTQDRWCVEMTRTDAHE